MPNIEQKVDMFMVDLKPLVQGKDNAKTTVEIAKIFARTKGIDTSSPYSTQFRSLKSTINRWLKMLNEMKRIKRKAIPSNQAIDAFIYWDD